MIFSRFRNLILSLTNALDYPLRQAIRLSRGIPEPKVESKADLFSPMSAEGAQKAWSRLADLRELYPLQNLDPIPSRELYRKNLYYLDLLDRGFSQLDPVLPPVMDAADVGPSHWFYARALMIFLSNWRGPGTRKVRMTGYEPDAFRIYADFSSRIDHARANMTGLDEISYVPGEFPENAGPFDLITHFFPFVFLDDHLRWGLPRKLFTPGQLLERIWANLKPGGILVLVNQGERESRAQDNLLQAYQYQGMIRYQAPTEFYRYPHPSIVTLIQK